MAGPCRRCTKLLHRDTESRTRVVPSTLPGRRGRNGKIQPDIPQDLRKLERLVGRSQARALARKAEACAQQAARRANRGTGAQRASAKTDAEIAKELVESEKAGWVKGPNNNAPILVEVDNGCVLKNSKGKVITNPKFKHAPQRSLNKDVFLQHLKGQRIERYVPYMYLDEYGNVTVGIGHLITDADKAEPLPFVERGTNNRADKDHIRKAFNKVRISNLTPGQAHLFESLTHIEISEPEDEKLAMEDMGIFLNILMKNSYFPDLGTYPITAKMGILDMAYTLGAFGTRTAYPRFTAAVRRRNWKLAAQHSHRPQVSAERDAIIRDWFKQAAKQEPFFIHPNCTKKLMVQ